MALIDYNNGTATISINGGQPPFSYLLLQNGTAVNYSGANFQNPVVSPNNSVIFGNSSDTSGTYGLPSGTYTCQVTDNAGCVTNTTAIVIGQTLEATTTTIATTTSTTLLQEYTSLTVDQSPVNEGLNILFTLESSNIPNGSMVDWDITGGITSDDISGSLAGSFTIQNNQAQYLATIESDEILEGQEQFTLTLAAIDTNGVTAGLSVDVIINDMNTAATTTTTLATTTLPTFDCATAQLSVDDGVVGDGVVFENVGNATGLVPAQYVLGSNTYTATIIVPATDVNGNAYSNAGASIECTATAIGTNATTLATTTLATTTTTLATTTLATTTTTLATTTIAPVEYELFTAYLNRDEGQSAFFELQYTNGTPGTTVGFTLSGTATPAQEFGGEIEPMDYAEPTDMFFTVGTSGFVILEIPINEDQQTEGTETIILTLDAQDSDGNPTGSLQKTVTINDTSELQNWEIVASTHDEGTVDSPAPTFNHILKTEHAPAGTEYFWYVSVAIGFPWTPASAADFVGGVIPSGSGTIPVYNETLAMSDSIPISIVADSLTEGNEVYQIIVKEGSPSNPGTLRVIQMMTITDSSLPTTTLATTTLATTTTTLATTTLATTTTLAPEDLYWFHTGEATWPYSKDLMSNDPQYFPPDGTNQSNSTPKFKQTFADMLTNPSGYETVNATQQFNTGTQLAFDASIGSSYYWILIPDSMGIPDLTQTAGLADTQNNTSDVAHSKMAMEVGGNPYTLYRVNLLSSTSAVTIEYTL